MMLEARNLTVSAALDSESVPVINDLSFTLAPGRVLGLVGESGAGKSMVGRTVAQLLPPGFGVTSGHLEFAGTDLVSMDAEERRALLGREIAFIPQEPLSALNPVLTVGKQFDEHLARIGVGPSERRERMRVAGLRGLDELLRLLLVLIDIRSSGQFSGGHTNLLS